MIIDARQFESDQEVACAVAIIGAGAAGITVALELEKHFKDVLLLESGGFEFNQDIQSLYEGPILGQSNTDIGFSRLRFLGGSTNHWEGQCAPFDAVDFEWIEEKSHSGWPFDLDHLTPFYERAYPYCELGPYQKNAPMPGQVTRARGIVDSPELALTEFRYSPPTRFGQKFRADLESSQRVRVLLNTNVTNISVADGGHSVSSIHTQTLDGKKLRVRAAAYILCCGGIENPRILLNCNDFFPNGIGNDHDLVGRFYMDHLRVEVGAIIPAKANAGFDPFSFRYDGIDRVRPALKNAADIVRKASRRGCSVIMEPEFEVNEKLLQASKSPAYAAFQRLARYGMRGQIPHSLGETECAALEDTGAIATVLYHRAVTSFWKGAHLKTIYVRLEGEQSPNPDSRVVLVHEIDALGMRRVGLDWQITAEDRQNLHMTTMALARGIGAAGFGRLVTPGDADPEHLDISTHWHHMGTTRMHDDPRQGVVDRNCKVDGLANLFIAGSSVFPTGSRVNPTVTIIALAIRLSDHLKGSVSI